jgi:hypothetical protein
MSKIFISYRRHDSQMAAGRIRDHIGNRFGNEAVFRDVDTLLGGVDFVQAIDEALAACNAFVLVIGPRWLTEVDAKGRRRIDIPEDLARVEVVSALARKIRIIPVLVDGAQVLSSDDLPADLRAIAQRQAVEITDARFQADMEELIRALEAAIGRPPAPDRSPSPAPSPSPSPSLAPAPARPVQPGRLVAGGAPTVPNHLVWSIVNTVCLCPGVGVVALLKSNKCSTALASGDLPAAQAASAEAKRWNTVISLLGAAVWLIGLIAKALGGN